MILIKDLHEREVEEFQFFKFINFNYIIIMNFNKVLVYFMLLNLKNGSE